MNYKNIIIALLLACTFVSCTKDDDPDLPQGPVEVVVSFAAVAEANAAKTANAAKATRATADGTASENFIGNLATFIFDANGQLLGSSVKLATESKSITEAEPVLIKIIKGEANYTAVLVANYGTAFTPTSISTLTALNAATATEDISKYVEASNLPMVSKPIVFSATALKAKGEGVDNWIQNSGGIATTAKDPVKLQRLISRVDLVSIAANFKETYPKASLLIDSFALMNVCSKATIEAGIGDTVKGYQYEHYSYAQDWIHPTSRIVKQLAGIGNWKSEGNLFLDGATVTRDNTNGWGWKSAIFSSYTFSNKSSGKYKTALLISGWFKYDNSDTKEVAKRRHYRVFLADPDANPEFQVRPNYLYKIHVTITGEGSENEDKIEENVNLKVEIVADPWSVKTQNVPGEI